MYYHFAVKLRDIYLIVIERLNRPFVKFFFQAHDGIRDAQDARGLGDVYK